MPQAVIGNGCVEQRPGGQLYLRTVVTYTCTDGGVLIILAAEDDKPQYWQRPGGVVAVGTHAAMRNVVDACVG
jgi:hypothetical protein